MLDLRFENIIRRFEGHLPYLKQGARFFLNERILRILMVLP